ncbi:MAG: AmiS/UreI family transporter [Bifidobacteriaceae bacterium]|nr:AmiS/UreI family transporter [Bifidobacteriaceae bacterium]
MASVGLLYVGAILFINGVCLLGHISAKGAAPLNFFVGAVQVFTPTYLVVSADGDPATIAGAAGLYLFGFTYLWVGLNNLMGWDGRGLGWFSLFVVVVGLGFAAHDGFEVGNWPSAVMWLMWAVLWFMFFVLLGLGKTAWTAATGWVAAVEGVVTGGLPAMLMLTGHWRADAAFAIGLAVAGAVMLALVAPASKALAAKPAVAAAAV